MAETENAPATGTPEQQRHAILAPFLEQLDLNPSEGGDTTQPSGFVEVDGHRVELGAWEQSILRPGAGGPAPNAPVWAPMLAEGLAFQAKCLHQMERLESELPPPSKLQKLLDELVMDLAVGLALQEELQRGVNELIRDGELKEAKSLTEFRHRVVQGVSRLKERLSRESLEQAEKRSEMLIAEIRTEAKPQRGSLALDAARDASKSKVQREHRTGRVIVREARSRVKPLLGILGVSVLLWSILVLPSLKNSGPPVLRRADFGEIEGVFSVTARPPSVYVKIESNKWLSMSREERRQLLLELGRVAGEADYNGVQVRTTEGVPVGQWLKARGAILFDRSAGPS